MAAILDFKMAAMKKQNRDMILMLIYTFSGSRNASIQERLISQHVLQNNMSRCTEISKKQHKKTSEYPDQPGRPISLISLCCLNNLICIL